MFNYNDYITEATELLDVFKAEHTDWIFDEEIGWDENVCWYTCIVTIEGVEYWAVCYTDELADGDGYWTIQSAVEV